METICGDKKIEYLERIILEEVHHYSETSLSTLDKIISNCGYYTKLPEIIIAFDGPNTSGKTYFSKKIANNLKTKGIKCEYIRSINKKNKLGQEFSKRRWDTFYITDPLLIFGSTLLELIKAKSKNINFVLVDRYILSGKVFLSSCEKKEKSDINIKKEINNIISILKLPQPSLEIILITSLKEFYTRFSERYKKPPTEKEIQYFIKTTKLFKEYIKRGNNVVPMLVIDTSEKKEDKITYLESFILDRYFPKKK